MEEEMQVGEQGSDAEYVPENQDPTPQPCEDAEKGSDAEYVPENQDPTPQPCEDAEKVSNAEYEPENQDPTPPPCEDAEKGAPPTYEESIVSRIKKAKAESSGNKEFLQNLSDILCRSAIVLVIVAVVGGVSLALPISMIVIGALKKDDCPTESYIPIYMIVAGACTMCSCCVSLGKYLIKRWDRKRYTFGVRDQETLAERCLGYFNGILSLFMSAWFIAGNVWIYRAYKPSFDDSTEDDYCDKTLYLLAFWVTTSVYILIGLACCCFSLVFCAMCKLESRN